MKRENTRVLRKRDCLERGRCASRWNGNGRIRYGVKRRGRCQNNNRGIRIQPLPGRGSRTRDSFGSRVSRGSRLTRRTHQVEGNCIGSRSGQSIVPNDTPCKGILGRPRSPRLNLKDECSCRIRNRQNRTKASSNQSNQRIQHLGLIRSRRVL